MRLVVDTSVLVGDLLRVAGRRRLGDERLDLFLPEQMRDEAELEIPRRLRAFGRHRNLEPRVVDDLSAACLTAIDLNVSVIGEAIYSPIEVEARARSMRDPHDWPVVAVALAVGADVWTNANDFLGTGVGTWTTETLDAWLARNPNNELR